MCKNLVISKAVISATDLLKTMMLAQMLDEDKEKEVYVAMVLCWIFCIVQILSIIHVIGVNCILSGDCHYTG
jgi:hypothetical protein